MSVSNLRGCSVGVLAAGGGSDAVSLKDLLGVFQHRFIAELQVELRTQEEEEVMMMMMIPVQPCQCSFLTSFMNQM